MVFSAFLCLQASNVMTAAACQPPLEVMKTRDAVFAAAKARDAKALKALTVEGGFYFSEEGDFEDSIQSLLGNGTFAVYPCLVAPCTEGAFIPEPGSRDVDIYGMIADILSTDCTPHRVGDNFYYAWPSAVGKTRKELSEAERQALAAMNRLDEADIDEEGNLFIGTADDDWIYDGWAIYVDKDGRWVYLGDGL